MGLKSLLGRLLTNKKIDSSRDWKNNIVPHAVHAVQIRLNNSDSIFKTLQQHNGFIDLFPDKEYIQDFNAIKPEITVTDSSKRVFKGESWKLSIEDKPIQGVYDRSIYYSRMLRESIKVDGIAYQTISKHYPHEIINKFLVDFAPDLKYLSLIHI